MNKYAKLFLLLSIAVFSVAGVRPVIAAQPVVTVEKVTTNNARGELSYETVVVSDKRIHAVVTKWLDHQLDAYLAKVKPSPDNMFEADMDVHGDQPAYLGLKYTVSEYLGGAHPNTYIETFLFDGASGERLRFRDVFIQHDKSLKVISAETIREIEAGRGEALNQSERNGLLPLEPNYQNITFGKHGVIFHFTPYQIGARSLDEMQVEIPYVSLQTFMAPEIIRHIVIK